MASLSLSKLESVLRRAFRLKSPENIHEANIALFSFLSAFPGQSPALDSVLQECYHDKKVAIDKPTLELFIHCLSAIKDHLQPTAISQIWWDLVLRPALRKEHMSAAYTKRARELVVRGLGAEPGSGAFRERLLQIYLGDLPNPISSEDAVETVGLEEEDKEARTRWKDSLTGLLLEDGVKHPEVRDVLCFCIRVSLRELASTCSPPLTTSSQTHSNACLSRIFFPLLRDRQTSLLRHLPIAGSCRPSYSHFTSTIRR